MKEQNRQEQQMEHIERQARQDRRRWLMIMIALMAVEIAAAVLVSVFAGMKYAPYALIFAIIALAITAKLCVDQMGRVMQRQRTEKEKLDNNGSFSGFRL